MSLSEEYLPFSTNEDLIDSILGNYESDFSLNIQNLPLTPNVDLTGSVFSNSESNMLVTEPVSKQEINNPKIR